MCHPVVIFPVYNPVSPPCSIHSGGEVDTVELLHVELEAAGVLVARLADGALELGAGSPGLLPAPQVLPLLSQGVRFTYKRGKCPKAPAQLQWIHDLM